MQILQYIFLGLSQEVVFKFSEEVLDLFESCGLTEMVDELIERLVFYMEVNSSVQFFGNRRREGQTERIQLFLGEEVISKELGGGKDSIKELLSGDQRFVQTLRLWLRLFVLIQIFFKVEVDEEEEQTLLYLILN